VLLGSVESLFLASSAYACSLDIARQQPLLEPVPQQLPSDLLAEHPCAADDANRIYAVVAPSASSYGRFAERRARIAAIASVTKLDTNPVKTTSASRPARGLP
jgi:hypothetical protein